MKDKKTLITMQQLRTCNINKMNDKEKVITMYLRSSKGVRQIAKNLGLPFTFAAIVRALWLRYTLTNKRITIVGGWFGRNKTQVSLSNIEEIRSVPRGFGSYGDMVLILNDGSKVEMKSLPQFREKQEFIEKNINKKSANLNTTEVEGFATK